jgi:hypothetical protein
MELLRANKITAVFSGEGVITASFYRTHTKLGVIKSDDAKIAELGYVAPVAGEGEEITPTQKLIHFKEFIQLNAVQFGYTFDPVDRRSEGNKFPSKYDAKIFAETGIAVVTGRVAEITVSLQKSVDSLVKSKALAGGSVITSEVISTADDLVVNPTEAYKDGSLKYADAEVAVRFTLNGLQFDTVVPINLVSGQLKKSREIGADKQPLTVTSVKKILVEANLLPVVEKVKEEETVAEVTAEGETVVKTEEMPNPVQENTEV